MTTYQYMLVQCPTCQKWFLMRGMAGKRVGTSLEHLAEAESRLINECKVTNHLGRRRWRGIVRR